jgi:hemolysin III
MTTRLNDTRGWMPEFSKPAPKAIGGVFVSPADCAEIDGPHYPTPAERRADLIIHIIGLAFAVIGGGAAIALAASHGVLSLSAAIAVYALGFIAMLSFSAAYNFAHPRWQPLLFRLDHAGIFLMIAASYTPFTTQLLHGVWSWGLTTAVWTLAIIGVFIKLCLPRLGETVSMVFYLVMGWLVVLAIQPLIEQVPLVPLLLLAAGGIVYSVGAVLFVMKRCRFRRAIWHGHVVAGAITHYAAIMVGVVLVGG